MYTIIYNYLLYNVYLKCEIAMRALLLRPTNIMMIRTNNEDDKTVFK